MTDTDIMFVKDWVLVTELIREGRSVREFPEIAERWQGDVDRFHQWEKEFGQ